MNPVLFVIQDQFRSICTECGDRGACYACGSRQSDKAEKHSQRTEEVDDDDDESNSLFDDDEEEDDDDEDDKDWRPTGALRGKGLAVLRFNDNTFIDKMSALVDNNQDSYRSFAKMLRALFILGGADPADFPLSDTTVSRHLKTGRESSATKAFQQDFPPNGILHFDGIKKKLGRRQGGGKFAIEHMCLTYTCGAGEWKIGIYQLPDGKGLLLKWQRICQIELPSYKTSQLRQTNTCLKSY